MKRWTKIYGWVFAALLLAFTAYAALDTFAISRVYAVVEPQGAAATAEPTSLSRETDSLVSVLPETEVETETAPAEAEEAEDGSAALIEEEPTETPEPVVTENSYTDEHIAITIETYRVEDTTVYVADVQVDDPSYLQTAFSKMSYGRNVTAATSATAETVDAILAVNGDNYGSREAGYVLRNGVLYRDTAAKNQEDLVIYEDGSFEIINESEVTAQTLLANGAVQIFSFGPGLVENGEVIVGTEDEVDRAMTSNPRTAIAILDEGHYLLVVSDGRTKASEGLTLYELAEFLQSLGVESAYNLDGGGSSTMVFMGQVVNQPTSGHAIKERAVTDIVYVGY